MKAKLNRIRLRDVALFAVVAGVVAVVVVLAGREAGIGEQAGAGVEAQAAQAQEGGEGQADSAEPLTLTLIAQEDICETKAALELISAGLRTNDRGQRVDHDVSLGWEVRSETPVRWRVTGGTGPYTLMIDGESRDRLNLYEGPLGRALVGCADASVVGTSFDDIGDGVQRLYDADPQVDSGPRTIRATVTDGIGSTAEASVEIYVIRTDAEILRRGQTYRVWGDHLVTAPRSHDVALTSPPEIECEERDDPDPYDCEPAFGFLLLPDGHQDDWLTAIARVNLYVIDGTEESRRRKLDDGTWIEITAEVRAASDANDPILAALDEIANSVGDPPRPR